MRYLRRIPDICCWAQLYDSIQGHQNTIFSYLQKELLKIHMPVSLKHTLKILYCLRLPRGNVIGIKKILSCISVDRCISRGCNMIMT